MVTIFTSIPPSTKRILGGVEIGKAYQEECVRSWTAAGFAVASLNNQAEIDLLADIYSNVVFLPIAGDRPKLSDFFRVIQEADQAVAGIANADCLFIGSQADAANVCNAAKNSLVLLERVNIDPDKMRPTGLSCYGFDAFIFGRSYIDQIDVDINIL